MSQPLHDGWTRKGSWFTHEDGTRVNGRAAYEAEVAKRMEPAPAVSDLLETVTGRPNEASILSQHTETSGNAVTTITMEDAEALTDADATDLIQVGTDGKVVVSFEDLEEAESKWYGPYTNLTSVTTPFGMYNVPYGKRMKMVPGKAKSIKHGGQVDTMVPLYENVEIVGDDRTAPTRR